MREYDDENIRLYTPVLQRVIILLAVIIAVPVVMWTITTMVRTYVAAPKAPVFQRLTDNPPSDTASVAAVGSRPAAPEQAQSAAPTGQLADAGTPTSDAHTPLLDIRKPADQTPTTVAPAAPASAPQTATAVASPSIPKPAAPAMPRPMTVASAPPMARLLRRRHPSHRQPSACRLPPAIPAVRPRAAAAGNIAWPNAGHQRTALP